MIFKMKGKEGYIMHPILRDLPTEFTSERLLIRMPLPGDGKKVYDAIRYSRTSLQKWLPFAQQEQSEEEVEINVRLAHIDFLKREDLRLHIFCKKTKNFIGSSGLHRIDWDVPKVEIGYWIDDRYSGKGYITEAVERITMYAIDEIKARRIEIHCDEKNVRSRAIPERLGFELEGIFKQDSVAVNGQDLRNTCVYAKVFNT